MNMNKNMFGDYVLYLFIINMYVIVIISMTFTQPCFAVRF